TSSTSRRSRTTGSRPWTARSSCSRCCSPGSSAERRRLNEGGRVTTKILGFDTYDVRFPTSRDRDGSDAMNPDPDYSAAYLVLRTAPPAPPPTPPPPFTSTPAP